MVRRGGWLVGGLGGGKGSGNSFGHILHLGWLGGGGRAQAMDELANLGGGRGRWGWRNWWCGGGLGSKWINWGGVLRTGGGGGLGGSGGDSDCGQLGGGMAVSGDPGRGLDDIGG